MEAIEKTKARKLSTTLANSAVVQAYNKTKIKDTSLQAISDWIKRILVILGLPIDNAPNEQEHLALVNSIRSELGYYTLEEMELAVKLALHGKINYSIDFYKRKFSLAWVIALMKAYKDYRSKDVDFKKYLKTELQLPEKTKQEQYNTLRSGLMELWGRFKREEDIFSELEWYYYSTLDEYCDLFNPTKKQKLFAIDKAKPLLEAQLKAIREKEITLRGMIAASMPTIPNDQQLKNKAKELLMKDFFLGLKEMDMDLELPEKI